MMGRKGLLAGMFAAVLVISALLIGLWALEAPLGRLWPVILIAGAFAGAFTGLTLPLWREFRNPAFWNRARYISLAYLAGALASFGVLALVLWQKPSLYGDVSPAIGTTSLVFAGGLGYLAKKMGCAAILLINAGLKGALALAVPLVLIHIFAWLNRYMPP